LEKWKKYDVNVKKNMVFVNEDSFNSLDGKIYWLNNKAFTGEFYI